jgi:hypothetical protein
MIEHLPTKHEARVHPSITQNKNKQKKSTKIFAKFTPITFFRSLFKGHFMAKTDSGAQMAEYLRTSRVLRKAMDQFPQNTGQKILKARNGSPLYPPFRIVSDMFCS